MRAPDALRTLVEDGFIDAVLRPLQSGKEAQVFVVLAGGEHRIAKVYKTAEQRNFRHRSEYQEGRGTRNTRDQRAKQRRSSYGRSRDEDAWQSTEVDMIRRLAEVGVRVPQPHFFGDGVLIMELVQDEDGEPAPRLGDLRVSPEDAVAIHDALLRDVVRMLCAGVVHGDLSEFNVLVDEDGPVIIDLPQAVDASSNPNARKLLLRDVENLQTFVTRWVPGRKRRQYGAEMWALYELNELDPEAELTGVHEASKAKASTDDLLGLIADAEEDETLRRIGRGDAPVSAGRDAAGRRVLVNEEAPAQPDPPKRQRPKRTRRPSSERTKPAAAPPPPPPPKAPSHAEVVARAMETARAAGRGSAGPDGPDGPREAPTGRDRPARGKRRRRSAERGKAPAGERARDASGSPSESKPAKAGDGRRRARPPGDGERRSRPPGDDERRARPSGDGERRARPSGDGERRARPSGDGERRAGRAGEGDAPRRRARAKTKRNSKTKEGRTAGAGRPDGTGAAASRSGRSSESEDDARRRRRRRRRRARRDGEGDGERRAPPGGGSND